MCSAEDEAPSSLRRVLGKAESNPSPHRVAPKMRRGKIESIEDRDDITHMQTQFVRRRLMRFITLAMATGVHQDKAEMRLQSVDVTMSRPTLHIPRRPVLQNQSRSLPLDSIVDPDTLV